MTDNKLIAEFMGIGHLYPCNTPIDTLEYHTSWDWLMPVVEKIEAIHGVYRKGGMTNGGQMHNATDTKYLMEYGMYDKSIAHIYSKDRLSAEYKAVVEFIKFYNIDIEKKKIEAFLSLTHKNK